MAKAPARAKAVTRKRADVVARRSDSKSDIKMQQDVYVTMRDGVRIALRIWRPAKPGRYPALYAASPYQYEYDDVPAYAIFAWRETGPVEWYVRQGYVYIHADVRGSGRSEGTFHYMDAQEQQDNHDVIEWIARQPWCSGKVGGVGQSYFGTSQWFMATSKPPHLACIAPYDASLDAYRSSAYHGGILCGYRSNWYNNTVRFNNLHRPADSPRGKAMEWDFNYEIFNHPTYDDFWKERSAYERMPEVKIPVLSIGHWGKKELHLRGNLEGYERAGGPRWLVVTGAANVREAHHLYDEVDFHKEHLLPFYDRYLKGEKNGWEKTPPVRIWVRGEEAWRAEKQWPLARAEYQSWYLRKGPSGSVTSLNDGGLTPAKPVRAEKPTSYSYPDPEWKVGVVALVKGSSDPVRRVLTFTSAPLAEDMEVTGNIVLELYASSDQIDTDFIVKLSDQRPQDAAARAAGEQPKFANVSKGWLKASHRALDPQYAKPHQPYYSHEEPQALTPGEVTRFEIAVMATSYVFKAGHRIRLEIVNGDSNVTDAVFAHPYHPSKRGTDTIRHEARYPSRLLLPVVPKGKVTKKDEAKTAKRRA